MKTLRLVPRHSWLFLAAVALAGFAFAGGTMGERSLREPVPLAVAVGMIASFFAVLWLGARRDNT